MYALVPLLLMALVATSISTFIFIQRLFLSHLQYHKTCGTRIKLLCLRAFIISTKELESYLSRMTGDKTNLFKTGQLLAGFLSVLEYCVATQTMKYKCNAA